jgi:SulP family sulfate permease
MATAASPSWIFRRIPALDVLRDYSWFQGRGDLIAGLTVATVAVPQAMAYGMVAGVAPEHGLYTAIVMTTIGALLDSSRQLINGPTNAISIAVLSALAVLPPEQRLQGAVLMAFLIGVFQTAITLIRAGDLTRYVSHSVIVGFTLGAGLLLPLDQLKNLLGLQGMGGVHDHFLVRFWLTLTQGGPIHLPTLAVGLGTMALIIGLRRAKERIGWRLFPELLASVVLSAAACAWFDLEAAGVKLVGQVPAKLPSFQAPGFDLAMMRELSGPALAIATLGLLEAISMARSIANQTRQKLDMNQQCLSEGLANLTGSFFQCIPGSGSLTRSTINQQAGAQTQWSGVVSAVAVAVIVAVFAPYARFIPKAALAGLLFVSSWKMIDHRSLLYHLRATRFDRIIVLTTAAAAVFISVEFCVIIGVLLSFLLAVPRAGRMMLTEFVVDEGGIIHERVPSDVPDPLIRIYGLEGEAFFGAAAALDAKLDRIEDGLAPEIRVVVLRVKRLRSPDAVVMHLIDGFVARLRERGVDVLLCGVRKDFESVMTSTRMIERIHADHVFKEEKVRNSSTARAVRCAHAIVNGNPSSAEEKPYYVVI